MYILFYASKNKFQDFCFFTGIQTSKWLSWWYEITIVFRHQRTLLSVWWDGNAICISLPSKLDVDYSCCNKVNVSTLYITAGIGKIQNYWVLSRSMYHLYIGIFFWVTWLKNTGQKYLFHFLSFKPNSHWYQNFFLHILNTI